MRVFIPGGCSSRGQKQDFSTKFRQLGKTFPVLLLLPVVGNDDTPAGLGPGGVSRHARHLLQRSVDHMTNLSLDDIGKEFEGRDHTTVLYSIDKVEKQMKQDSSFAEVVKELKTNINSKR